MFRLFGLWVVFAIVANVAIAWIGASAITSVVKAHKDECGKTYGIESVVAGDWFCPTSE